MSGSVKIVLDAYPAVEALVPHRGPMLLLEHVIEITEQAARCSVLPRLDALSTSRSNAVDSIIGIEYMAQTAAVFAGYDGYLHGMEPLPGYVVSVREVERLVESFTPGERLIAEATFDSEHAGTSVFVCAVRQAGTLKELMRGRITVHIPDQLVWPDSESGTK